MSCTTLSVATHLVTSTWAANPYVWRHTHFINVSSQLNLFLCIQGELRTDTDLDRETVPDYVLRLEARDNNNAPDNEQQKTSAEMTIHLLDVNDNNPVFQRESYTEETFENVGANQPILQG